MYKKLNVVTFLLGDNNLPKFPMLSNKSEIQEWVTCLELYASCVLKNSPIL